MVSGHVLTTDVPPEYVGRRQKQWHQLSTPVHRATANKINVADGLHEIFILMRD